jgi:glycosyltransferase involved in cell wall biosynthesis
MNQSYKGLLKIVVVDYSCPDKTSDFCSSLNLNSLLQVVYVDSPGFNISHARNVGAVAAQADILCFLDSHTMVVPDYVAIVVEALSTHSIVRAGDVSGSPSLLRDTLIANRGFDEALKEYGCEDCDFWNRVTISGTGGIIPRELVSVLHHTDEEKTRFYKIKNIWEAIAINEQLCRDLNRPINSTGFGL